MNEQTNTERINVEQLISQAQVNHTSLIVQVRDTLTLIQAIDPTLLKDVGVAKSSKNFYSFAVFGIPENDIGLVTLIAEE